MTWFKVDDTAYGHPKMLKAGNAALGLWMRCGAYAAQHLTEGTIPGVVAQLYGTAPQVRKLTAAGLWHPHGHDCARCPQPASGDYVMHDFLIYNPTKAHTLAERAAAADRQQRAREKAAQQRRNQERNPSDSKVNRPRFDDESSAENRESPENPDAFPEETAGQGMPSQRDYQDPSRSPRPDPTPSSTPYGSTTPPAPRPGTPGPAEVLLADWWTNYGRGTAQSRNTIGRAIADALGNGIDRQELARALDRLGEKHKPVTGGTLQYALADIRRADAPPAPGAAVIPLDPARGRVARAHDMFAAALAARQENAQ